MRQYTERSDYLLRASEIWSLFSKAFDNYLKASRYGLVKKEKKIYEYFLHLLDLVWLLVMRSLLNSQIDNSQLKYNIGLKRLQWCLWATSDFCHFDKIKRLVRN